MTAAVATATMRLFIDVAEDVVALEELRVVGDAEMGEVLQRRRRDDRPRSLERAEYLPNERYHENSGDHGAAHEVQRRALAALRPPRGGYVARGAQTSSPRRKRNCMNVMKPTTATKTTDIALDEPTLNEVLNVS